MSKNRRVLLWVSVPGLILSGLVLCLRVDKSEGIDSGQVQVDRRAQSDLREAFGQINELKERLTKSEARVRLLESGTTFEHQTIETPTQFISIKCPHNDDHRPQLVSVRLNTAGYEYRGLFVVWHNGLNPQQADWFVDTIWDSLINPDAGFGKPVLSGNGGLTFGGFAKPFTGHAYVGASQLFNEQPKQP